MQADDHEYAGRLVGHPQLGLMRAQHLDQFVADDFDDLLGGRKRGEHFLAERLFLDGFDELLDHAEVDVGFEQGDADFAQGGVHVLRREFALSAQSLEYALQLVA